MSLVNWLQSLFSESSTTHSLSAADGEVLEQLRRAGSNLALPHPINHYLYFPTEQAAQSAAATLKAEGYDVEVKLGADDTNWLVLASHVIVPKPSALSVVINRMERLASSLGGDFDGWEAKVMG